MHSSSPSRSRHRAAYLLLNPGSSAPARTLPLHEGESWGCDKPVQEERAGIPRERLREMTAQPWTTQEPACKRALTYRMRSEIQGPNSGAGAAAWTPRGQGGPHSGSGRGQGHMPAPTDTLGEPRTNQRHRSFHMPVLSALDPQVSNEYFRFQPYLQPIKKKKNNKTAAIRGLLQLS